MKTLGAEARDILFIGLKFYLPLDQAMLIL